MTDCNDNSLQFSPRDLSKSKNKQYPFFVPKNNGNGKRPTKNNFFPKLYDPIFFFKSRNPSLFLQKSKSTFFFRKMTPFFCQTGRSKNYFFPNVEIQNFLSNFQTQKSDRKPEIMQLQKILRSTAHKRSRQIHTNPWINSNSQTETRTQTLNKHRQPKSQYTEADTHTQAVISPNISRWKMKKSTIENSDSQEKVDLRKRELILSKQQDLRILVFWILKFGKPDDIQSIVYRVIPQKKV